MSEVEVLWQLRAAHDVNGNPRRALVHVVYGEDALPLQWGAYDEGYAGSAALPPEVRDLWDERVTVDVTVKQYRDALRLAYVPGQLQGV